MADGHATMQAWIDMLRELPDELVKASVPAVVQALGQEINGDVAAARGPDGEPWAPKQDGGRALQNAAQQVTVEAVGTVILAKLKGPEVRHHKGTARGGIRRQILPTRKIPDNVSRAIRAAFTTNFARLTGAGS